MNTIDESACKDRKESGSGGNLLISGSLTPAGRRLDRGNRSHRRNRWGAAAVEFAVIVPVFLLFVFGMVEFGRAIMVQQMLTNASREGARLAVLDGSSGTDIRSTVKSYLQTVPVQDDDIEIDPPNPSSASFGDPVSVEVSIGFDQVSWLPTPMFLRETRLSATTVMRRESVQ